MAVRIELAGRSFAINSIYPYFEAFASDYLVGGTMPEGGDIVIDISQSDIDYERSKSEQEEITNRLPHREFGRDYLETLAIYRRIAERLSQEDTILVHGSAVAVDGECFLFVAKSGTGKSTHTSYWRELFGERAVMINDDKPLVRITQDGCTVYGTPWDGKHRLSTNTCASLKGICILTRDEKNHIERLNEKEAYVQLLQHIYRPREAAGYCRVLELLGELIHRTGVYSMGCNMSTEAAKVAYQGMHK